MIAVDTNLLVYAHRSESPGHAEARGCLRGLAEGRASWAIPWPCLHEFFAMVTHPRVFSPPTPLSSAIEQIDAWLASPAVALLGEGPGYWTYLKKIAVKGRIAGPLVHDARVAALCRYHGVSELWSADRDFGRFPDLTVRNPLV